MKLMKISSSEIAVGSFLVLAIIYMAFTGYKNFESGIPTGKSIEGNVKAYVGCSAGPSTDKSGIKNSCFRVELSNGFSVYIRDYGVLPINYTGPVVLNLATGTTTGLPMYTFDIEQTNSIHNKAIKVRPSGWTR